LAKEQVQSNPVTEPKRSQNPKRPLLGPFQPNGYSISENALAIKVFARTKAACPERFRDSRRSPRCRPQVTATLTLPDDVMLAVDIDPVDLS